MKNIIFIFSLLFTTEIFCKSLTDYDLYVTKNQIATDLNKFFGLGLPMTILEGPLKNKDIDVPSSMPVKLKTLKLSEKYYKSLIGSLKALIKRTELFIKDSGSDLKDILPYLEKLVFKIAGSEPLNGQSLIEVTVSGKNTSEEKSFFAVDGLANEIRLQIETLKSAVNKITTHMPSKTRAKNLFQYWVGIPNTPKQNAVEGILNKLVDKILEIRK